MAEVEVQAAQNGSEEESPVKKGRGRPAKDKGAGDAPAPAKRGRGRPPKAGVTAVESPRKATTGKGRGRPAKRPAEDEEEEEEAADVDEVEAADVDDVEEKPVAKRGRGRPPKKSGAKAKKTAAKPSTGRGRGRPKKNLVPEDIADDDTAENDEESDEQ